MPTDKFHYSQSIRDYIGRTLYLKHDIGRCQDGNASRESTTTVFARRCARGRLHAAIGPKSSQNLVRGALGNLERLYCPAHEAEE